MQKRYRMGMAVCGAGIWIYGYGMGQTTLYDMGFDGDLDGERRRPRRAESCIFFYKFVHWWSADNDTEYSCFQM